MVLKGEIEVKCPRCNYEGLRVEHNPGDRNRRYRIICPHCSFLTEWHGYFPEALKDCDQKAEREG